MSRAPARSVTVKHHLRAARRHRKLAQEWEVAGERQLASREWSRVTIHRRAAEIKRQLGDREEGQAA